MADFELDLRGLSCPLPVIHTKKKMLTMKSGQTLRVLSSEADSVSDFRSYTKSSGNILLESRRTPEGDYEFVLKRA